MKDIVLNLLFILVVLFSVQLVLEYKGRRYRRKTRAFCIFLSSLVSTLFCMTFSIEWGEQRFDLRAIPFVIGGLFGGPIVTVALYVSMILYRFILGINAGLWGSLINYGIMTILLLILYKRFNRPGATHKILITTSLIVLHALLIHFVYTYILHVTYLPMRIFIETSLIKLFTSVIIIMIAIGFLRHTELRERLENMEKTELVSHLSASISHEVRNGLTSVYGFLQLLREKESEAKKQGYIQHALEELIRTENIVRDFLTFAKPSPRRIEKIGVDEVIHNSIALIEPLANMSSIEIRKHVTKLWIEGDKSLIQQSFINIFKNAIEAMPVGGVLDIQTITSEKENLITIKDTGIGMTQEQMDRMGTPYYTTKGQKGTGLGMMVAYRIIQEMGGKIKVYSKVSEGTTFVIHLPKCSES